MARTLVPVSSQLSRIALGIALLGASTTAAAIAAGCEGVPLATPGGADSTDAAAGAGDAGPGQSFDAGDPLPDDAFDGGAGGPNGPRFGPTRSLADAPPSISGGTLLAMSDGAHVVASDPDRDRIYVVDLATRRVATIALQPHDEPGRLVEDANGRANVVLRAGGALLTIDVAAARTTDRRHVCAAPRGVDFDLAGDRLVVACDSGELFELNSPPPWSSRGPRVPDRATLLARLGAGIRDVVVTQPRGGEPASARIFVSRFRTAEILELDATGALITTQRPSPVATFDGGGPSRASFAEATLAWRMVAAPPGSAADAPVVVHQFAITAAVAAAPGGYGASASGFPGSTEGGAGVTAGTACTSTGIVHTAISQGSSVFFAPDQLVLPVDIVASADGFAVVAAGNGHTATLPQVYELTRGSCGAGAIAHSLRETARDEGTLAPLQPVAIARLANGSLLVQSREPARLVYVTTGDIIDLATDSREDTGHAIFHFNSGTGIACASCHGEGGDDAHVWTFTSGGGIGDGGVGDGGEPRRTPSLHGTLKGTAPYHWDGAMKDIDMLAEQVMTGRMNGPVLSASQKRVLQSWLFAIPAPVAEPVEEPASFARGKALFESPDVGCAGCHSGPHLTSSVTIDVGTGGAFQVPPLVGVRNRAPYMHDGCAATLSDRFGPCGGTRHGHTSQLGAGDIADLVAYLQRL